MDENFEKSWKFYSLIIDWIKFSDTKAAVVLSVNGVFFGLIFKNLSNIIPLIFNASYFLAFMALIAIMGVITGIISIFFAIYCLIPNTNNSYSAIFFFGHISGNFKNAEDYKKEFNETISNDQELNKQVTEQIWEISRIALNKYNRVKWAILFLGITIALLIPLAILGTN